MRTMAFLWMIKTSWSYLRPLWQGKSGSSELYESIEDQSLAVLKTYQYNPENYISLDDALNTEVYSYETLRKIGITVPLLLGLNRRQNILLKEYAPGPTIMECLGQGPLPTAALEQACHMSRLAREKGYNLDWFPANFVWMDQELTYIDYEVQPWMAEWSFEEWGAWYWFNPEGFAKFLKTKDGDHINYPGTPKPYKEGLYLERYHNFFSQTK
jgi:TP53 regulating kinase-like protein